MLESTLKLFPANKRPCEHEASRVGSFVTPRIDLPFASTINPFSAELEVHIATFLSEIGIGAAGRRNNWCSGRYDQLVARMYPTAPLPLLMATSEAVLWLFLYDDFLDPGGPGDDRVTASQIMDNLRAVLEGACAPRPEEPVFRCLARVRTNLLPMVSPTWWKRYSEDVLTHALSIRDELNERMLGESPELSSYLARRRISSGWIILTDFVELNEAFELPEVVQRCAEHTELIASSAEVASTINDILSLRKEINRGELHNIVLILQKSAQCSLEEAISLACARVKLRLEGYHSVRASFLARFDGPEFSPAEREGIEHYVTGLENLMRGSLDWSTKTSRYAASDS
jgi:5-epi-alpha-selinene synthase